MMMNRLRNRFQVWSRDGISLSKELWNSKNYEEGRSTLISFANDKNNIWAISFFKLEKEINLIQYYGPIQYIKQQQQQQLSIVAKESNTTTNNNNKNKEDNMNTAKVAFMITSIQRKELQTMLGYTPKEIKSLNPTQAQIILQHQLPPTAEGQIKLKQLLTNLQSSSDNNNNTMENNDTTTHPIDHSVTSQMTFDMSSSLAIVPKTSNHDHHPDNNDSTISNKTVSSMVEQTTKLPDDNDSSWYEVIQYTKFKNKETEKEVIQEETFALYRTKSEAQDCIDIKQKHGTNDVQYSIRKKL